MLRRNRSKLVTFVDGGDKIVDVRNVHKLAAIALLAVGTLTVSGGTTDGAMAEDGILKTLFKNLRLETGGHPFVHTHGQAEYFRRAIQSGSAGVLVAPATPTAGAHAVKAYVVIDLDQAARNTLAHDRGRLNADVLHDLDLVMEFGNVEGDMVTGGDRAESFAGTVEIVPMHFGTEWRAGHRVISRRRVDVTGAGDDMRIDLPSKQMISHILLIAVDNGVRSNSLVTRVRAFIGDEDKRVDSSWNDLQADNVEAFGIPTVSGDTPYTGLALINFDALGDMDPGKLFDLTARKEKAGKIVIENGAPTGVSYVEAITYGIKKSAIPGK